jgi:pSer/pThr/pTyr-binding forkhead associated (FHA) protein
MPKLVVEQSGTRDEFALGPGPVTLGRGAASDIRITDERASRQHCRVEYDGANWFVVDLDSSNGTTIDGQRIARQQLTDGLEFCIGQTRVRFVAADSPATQAEPGLLQGCSLRVVQGLLDALRFPLQHRVTTIGRSKKCDVFLEDPQVSKLHAEIILGERGARIVDKDSRNGIKVNRVAVKERNLDHGDRIAIGDARFIFETTPTTADEAAAAAGAREVGADAPAATLFTPRVKILAGVVGLILLLGIIVKLADPETPPYTRYPDNLIQANPSFEAGQGSLSGWSSSGGNTALVTSQEVADGSFALQLVSRESAGPDVSAECFADPVTVTGGKAYELSAFLRNAQGEALALAVRWSGPQASWLRATEIGERSVSATAWQRVSHSFRAPRWARQGRFGFVLIGQGAAFADGVRLRETEDARPAARRAAGRIAVTGSTTGEFLVEADGQPLFGRGRALVAASGRVLTQMEDATGKGAAVTSRRVQFVGYLGVDRAVPFTEVISTSDGRVTVHYDIDLSKAAGAIAAIQMRSGLDLLGPSVSLETSSGMLTEESKAFEGRRDVSLITFAEGSRRVFLQFPTPATVSVKAAENHLVWRLEFPSASARARATMHWSANSGEAQSLVKAALDRAGEADQNQEYGSAIKLYQAFIQKHPLHAAERARAARAVRGLKQAGQERVKAVRQLAARARATQAEADFVRAESACRQLLGKLKGADEEENVARLLSSLVAQHKAASERIRTQKAAERLAEAQRFIDEKKPVIAGAILRDVAETYPGTPAAKEAQELLESLPQNPLP